MKEPKHYWQSGWTTQGKVDVLVFEFEHDVDLQIAGSDGLRIAIGTNTEREQVVAEMERAVAWARANDARIATLFRERAER